MMRSACSVFALCLRTGLSLLWFWPMHLHAGVLGLVVLELMVARAKVIGKGHVGSLIRGRARCGQFKLLVPPLLPAEVPNDTFKAFNANIFRCLNSMIRAFDVKGLSLAFLSSLLLISLGDREHATSPPEVGTLTIPSTGQFLKKNSFKMRNLSPSASKIMDMRYLIDGLVGNKSKMSV